MENDALLCFLKEANMSKKEIRRIKSAVKKGNHFLISLLTDNCQDTIPKLYKSAYVISKLAEAGYETDPRTADARGFSALGHALIAGDAKTVYELYFFAANNCFRSECSYRNPDGCVVDNLRRMEKIFLDDLDYFRALRLPANYDEFKKKSQDLLRLNKFLIELNSKIIEIIKLNDESANERVFEARKRRDVIVSILDKYQEFSEPIQQESSNLSPLDDYIMFKSYYYLIDIATAKIFFDNILLLKERLKLEDTNQFSEIESSFWSSVMYQVVFEKIDSLNMFEKLDSSAQEHINSLYIFPLIMRRKNMSKIVEFSKNLQDIHIKEDNVETNIPRSDIKSSLNSLPFFKDSMHLERLKRYLKIAVNVKVTDVKSTLVMQRVLQVIGEYLTSEKDHSYRTFLSLMLPEEVCNILRQTRNELSHVESYVFKSKVECEKNNISLFQMIQKEIRAIRSRFGPVFQTQEVHGIIGLVKIFDKHLDEIREHHHLYASLSFYPFYIGGEFRLFLNQLRPFLLDRHRSAFKEILKAILCRVENDISKEINKENWENLKDTILNILWPLKWTIELLQELGDTKAEIPLKEYETLKNCNQDTDPVNDLKNKTSNFLSKSKELLSLIFISRRKREIKPLEQIKNVHQFLHILKGFIYLSDEVKDEIREAIPETIIAVKEKLMKSIEDGFSLDIRRRTPEFEVSYLSNNKKNKFWTHYRNKEKSEALAILKNEDPMTKLEEIFSENPVKYKTLCNAMQLSCYDKWIQISRRLAAAQNIEIPGNNLSNLLDRVQWLKTILIQSNGEVLNPWLLKAAEERTTSRACVVDNIAWCYSRDLQLQAAVEMLVLDCASVYENAQKKNAREITKNPWDKPSKLYCGINMRNVLSHGSPLLESLCSLVDPEDMPCSALIQKILRLIEDEDIIRAILELYEEVGNDYLELRSKNDDEDDDEYVDIRKRILKNSDEWKNYVVLLK